MKIKLSIQNIFLAFIFYFDLKNNKILEKFIKKFKILTTFSYNQDEFIDMIINLRVFKR